jgi:deoxyribodipyrimidine photo-lyase
LPQLAKLPAPVLHEPWAASPIELSESGLTLGQDYPLPVVRHDEARTRTLQRYAVVKKSAA